jgi:hypothetical protein
MAVSSEVIFRLEDEVAVSYKMLTTIKKMGK